MASFMSTQQQWFKSYLRTNQRNCDLCNKTYNVCDDDAGSYKEYYCSTQCEEIQEHKNEE